MKGRVLRTRRLVLRPAGPADAAFMYAHRRRPELWVPGGYLPPKTPAASRSLLRRAAADWRKPGWTPRLWRVALRGGEPIGFFNLRWPHGGVAELGYGIEPVHQRRGYASEAARAVAVLAFRLGAHRVQATCWTKNPASAKVLVRAGLRKEGILRGYLRRGREIRDEFMFGLAKPVRHVEPRDYP